MSSVTLSKLTSLGLALLVSQQVVVYMHLPGLSFCDPRPGYSWPSIAPRYWPSSWPCGLSFSHTLNYFSGHVFDFLHLLARPDTHGFSNILHTFVSWSLFFSILLFSDYWKPIHFLGGLWASENSFPCRTFNTQQPIPAGLHLPSFLQTLLEIHDRQGLFHSFTVCRLSSKSN